MKNSGGRERVVSILSKEFCNKYNVEILVLDNTTESFYKIDDRVEVKTLGIKNKNKLISKIYEFNNLRKYMKNKPDNIYFTLSMRYLNLFVAISNIFLNNSIIATEHCDYYTTPVFFRLLKSIFYRKFTRIVTLTDKDRDIYIRKFNNVRTIVNPLSFYPEYISKNKEKVFLNVGRLTKQKGQDMLIEAWNKSNTNGWKLRIVGDGELKEIYTKMIKELNMENSIEILKPTKDILNYYMSSSVFILSSRWEGLPMVLLEAMSCGLPCISFDCETGPSQLIKDNYNGYLVEAENIDRLSEKINWIVENDSVIEKLRENSRVMARKYSVDKVAMEWYKMFEEVDKGVL